MKWNEGALSSLKIVSKLGNNCKIRYNEKAVEFKTKGNKAYFFNKDLILFEK